MSHDDAGASPAGEGRRSSSPGPAVAVPAASQEPPSYRAAGTDDGGEDVSGPAAGDRPQRGPGRLIALLGALAGGLVAGVFGTLLHAHLVYAGDTALPLGALGALLLAFSVFLLCGLWARNILTTAVAGAAAYVVVAVLSTSRQTLVVTGSNAAAPAVSLAGNLWLFGVVVMTLAAVVVTSVVLRRSGRR